MTISSGKTLPQIQLKAAPCKHLASEAASGVALIAMGNTLRGDDGIAQLVCRSLDTNLLDQVCYFDIGTASVYLPNCLLKHSAAVIVDAVAIESQQDAGSSRHGSVLVELPELIRSKTPAALRSSHGISFVDELKLFFEGKKLLKSLNFFGIYCKAQDWQHSISHELENKIPTLKTELELHLNKLLEEQE